MGPRNAAFWMSVAGTVCWGICFWWMGRISAKQNHLMDQLREQGRRIEKLSKVEHDLIKEVHPQVGEIKDGMNEMIAVVKENTATQALAAKENERAHDLTEHNQARDGPGSKCRGETGQFVSWLTPRSAAFLALEKMEKEGQ